MTKLFFSVACCVIVLNIIMMLLPSGSYLKYTKVACGLTTVAIVINIIFGSNIDFTLSKRYLDETFSVQEARDVAVNQSIMIIESNIKDELFNKFGRDFVCKVDDDFQKITVISYSDINEEQLKSYINDVCSVGRDNIIVRYNQENNQ